MTTDDRIAIVTPSFARDFESCRDLNQSVIAFLPPQAKHYIIVDACDLNMFRPLANSRTVVAAVEDVLPRGYVKLRFSKKWWFSFPAMSPIAGVRLASCAAGIRYQGRDDVMVAELAPGTTISPPVEVASVPPSI